MNTPCRAINIDSQNVSRQPVVDLSYGAKLHFNVPNTASGLEGKK